MEACITLLLSILQGYKTANKKSIAICNLEQAIPEDDLEELSSFYYYFTRHSLGSRQVK